jgi:hypothetical protein
MLPVAATLGESGRRGRVALGLAVVLALAGAILMLLFQGVGARIPHYVADPLFEVVLPLWRGAELPPWWTGQRFACNLAGLMLGPRLSALPENLLAVQFVPLVLTQVIGTAVCVR